MDPTEAVQRWDAFLAKLEARAQETLTQAEQGCAILLDINALDPLPMSNAWSAIENQLRELSERIQSTWDEKVEPPLEEAEWDGERLDRERAKGHAVEQRIEADKDRMSIKIFADAAQKIYAEAKRHLEADFNCSQCGGKLTVSKRFFRAANVNCPSCKSVNTFVPSSKVQAVEYFCCHHLARAKTVAQNDAWLAAEARWRGADEEDLAAMQAAETALKTYTEAYLRARIEIVPEYEKDFAKDLKGKMAFFYEMVGRTEAWQRAHR